MASTTQWKLRRLAERSMRVVERRKGESPALAAFEATLVPAAVAFKAAYDGVKRYNPSWQKEMSEGNGAAAALLSAMRRWLPRLAADLPAFDRATYADTTVPDDVIEDTTRLFEAVQSHQELAADAASGLRLLSYAEQLVADIEPVYQRARKEWGEAEAADSKYQQALAKTRALANDFDRELILFRETLAQVLGRSDRDYQKLRANKAATTEPEDDTEAPLPIEAPTNGQPAQATV